MMHTLVHVLIALLLPLVGCTTTHLTAKRTVEWQRRPGTSCFVRLVIDGGEETVEVTGPNACTPDPSFCEAP